MRKQIYCIKDTKSGFQPELMLFDNDAVAKRWFDQLLCDYKDSERLRNSPILLYPSDFELWNVGDYDLENGTLTAPSKLEFVISADALLEV